MPDNGSGITLTDLAQNADVPKGSLHRMLGQLVALEVLRREGDLYFLGRHLFRLTRRTDPDRQLRQVALPYLIELFRQTQETVHLGVMEGINVLYVERLGTPRQPKLPTNAGDTMPVYCTGLGKAMLAFSSQEETLERVISSGLQRRTPRTLSMPGLFLRELQRSRNAGFAQDREEAFAGVSCIAMPISGPKGTAMGAISVSSSGSRSDQNRVVRNLKLLQHATTQIARDLRLSA